VRSLDAATLAKLAGVKLRARAVMEGVLSGLHKSPHQGQSVEFSEHKEYAPGDELRHLDWKAFGKFDRYYVKRYEHETNLKATLVIDASGSMGAQNRMEAAKSAVIDLLVDAGRCVGRGADCRGWIRVLLERLAGGQSAAWLAGRSAPAVPLGARADRAAVSGRGGRSGARSVPGGYLPALRPHAAGAPLPAASRR